MIVRMKLVPRGNESSDNPPTLNLPGCRKPLAVVCVRDRCWTPSCRWTVCTRCSNLLRANLSFFFFSFFPSLLFVSLTEQKFALDTYLPILFFFFFNWHVRSFIRAQRRYTLVDNHFSCIIYNIRFFFLSFFFSLSPTRFFKFKRTLFDTVPYTSLAEICCTILKIDFYLLRKRRERKIKIRIFGIKWISELTN